MIEVHPGIWRAIKVRVSLDAVHMHCAEREASLRILTAHRQGILCKQAEVLSLVRHTAVADDRVLC